MMIWIILLAMTAAAVMAVLWPLSRHAVRSASRRTRTPASTGSRWPRSSAIANAARCCRRKPRPPGPRPRDGSCGRARRRAPLAGRRRTGPAPAQGGVDAGPVGGADPRPCGLWRPRVAAHPGAAGGGHRRSAAQSDLGAAIAQIEAHLAKNPQDGRGWEVHRPGLSPHGPHGRCDQGLRGRLAASRTRCRRACADYGEALVIAKDGLVSKEAQTAFEKAVELDPSSAKARLYLARAAEQDGRIDKAREDYAGDPDGISQRCAVGAAGARADRPSRQPARPRRAVSRQRRHRRHGVEPRSRGSKRKAAAADEWARLIRSYAVLGQRDKAAPRPR